ncbi:MAG: alpha/beta fold hydrolase [Arenicellales bacterium WSBS_2016_MAG_OTU3]
MSLDLYSRVNGNGQALLILHGLFGSNSNWRSIGKQLSTRFQVHLLDARNHGRSPWHDSHDYSSLANDVANYIEHRKLETCVVMGHSMGGKTAMLLALTQPELVHKLVVIDICPVVYQHGDEHKQIITAMQNMSLDECKSRKEIEKALGADIRDADLRGFLLQNLITSNDKFAWRINLEALKNNLEQLMHFPDAKSLRPFDGETLLLHGQHSHYFSAEYASVFRTLFPLVQIKPIANAGHWLHAEQPARLLELLLQFITR